MFFFEQFYGKFLSELLCPFCRRVPSAIKTILDDSTDNSGNNTSCLAQFHLRSCVTRKLRKGFPVKIMFFLIGFYFAMALASVVGQTGHWDLRVAFHSTPKDGVYILMMYSVQ
jgi:hypothetical protein